MITEIDIWRCANPMLKQHGENAALEAALRADAFLDQGDLDGVTTWRRILAAVEELQATKRAEGTSVH